MNAAGRIVPGPSWWPIIFNRSFSYRLVHTVIASYLTTTLVAGGAGPWHLLRDRTTPHARTMFSMAMFMATLVAPLPIIAGHEQGTNTLEHKPTKEVHCASHADRVPL